MANVRAHLLISGLVQGVGFRFSMRRVANQAGVTGWVHNRADGQVEAVLEGEEQDVRRVIEWSYRGPSAAEVDEVAVGWDNYTGEFGHFGAY